MSDKNVSVSRVTAILLSQTGQCQDAIRWPSRMEHRHCRVISNFQDGCRHERAAVGDTLWRNSMLPGTVV